MNCCGWYYWKVMDVTRCWVHIEFIKSSLSFHLMQLRPHHLHLNLHKTYNSDQFYICIVIILVQWFRTFEINDLELLTNAICIQHLLASITISILSSTTIHMYINIVKGKFNLKKVNLPFRLDRPIILWQIYDGLLNDILSLDFDKINTSLLILIHISFYHSLY